MSAPNDATMAQIKAARPDRSTWLSANAGSGKTRVLADRVIRLLLDGTKPERILCLTFTKAAAAEMSNRLHESLAEWATIPDADLAAKLTDLTGEPRIKGAEADLGAYEYGHRILYVRKSATGADDGSSWADAFQGALGLQDALAVAQSGDQVFVAQGPYKAAPSGDSTHWVWIGRASKSPIRRA